MVTPSPGQEAPSYSVVVPVGPAPEELARLEDLRASLIRHDAHTFKAILIDDAPQARGLDLVWPGAEVIRTTVWESGHPDPNSAQVAGSIEALRRVEGRFALKLDTDALAIAPYYDKIARRLDSDPLIGIVGAHDRTPNGDTRDWSRWPPLIRSARLPLSVRRGRRRSLSVRWRPHEQRAFVRCTLAAAAANPRYQLGAHCLGGAYAVSRGLLEHAAQWTWRPWVNSDLSEDVVLGLLCGAAGLRMEGMVADGDPFGVAWRGLPGDPDDLIKRGFSIVHSLKNCGYGTESELRDRFRELRAQPRLQPA